MIWRIAWHDWRRLAAGLMFWLLLAFGQLIIAWLAFAQLETFATIAPQLKAGGSTLGVIAEPRRQRRVARLGVSRLALLALLEEDRLVALQVDLEWLHRRRPAADVKLEQPPAGLAGADGAEVLVLADLVPLPRCCLLSVGTDHLSVVALVYVLK